MNAIGLIETIGYVAAIEASDACVKAANVNIVSLDKVGAGIVTLTVCGDVGAVKSAVEAGEMAASKVGTLRSSHVIPRMHNEVADALFKKEEPKVLEESNSTNELSLDVVENISEKYDETLVEDINEVSESTKDSNENLDSSIEEVEDNLTETIEEKIDDSNNEVLEQLEIDNEIDNTKIDNDNLSKHSVKELKAMAKKLDSSITYKELNILKKGELINLVKKLSGEDK